MNVVAFLVSSLIVITAPGPDLALITSLVLNGPLRVTTAAAFGMITAGPSRSATVGRDWPRSSPPGRIFSWSSGGLARSSCLDEPYAPCGGSAALPTPAGRHPLYLPQR